MTIPSSVLVKMATLGLSPEQAEAVAQMLSDVEEATRKDADAALEKSREKTRLRVQKWREKQPSNVTERYEASRNATERLVREPARVEDISSNLEISGKKVDKKISLNSGVNSLFDQWWAIYPRKVSKADARKQFDKALTLTDFDTLMAGVRRYAAERHGEDQQYTMHPDRWLRGQHWNDEPAPKPATGPPQDDFNSILDGYINGSIFDVHSQRDRSVRTGHSGPDRGSAQGVVQLHALPSRR